MNGMQDLSIAARYTPAPARAISGRCAAPHRGLRRRVPVTDYTPDFQPLSIGSASTRLSWRGTASMQGRDGTFVDASGAFTWRSNVTLEIGRTIFTEDQLHMTDEVNMPPVLDVGVMGGFRGPRLMAAATVVVQHMSSGGDIRRQDAPFVSNRMNALRVGGVVMYPLPKLAPLAVRASYAYTVTGRNVGQSNTVSLGLVYRFYLLGRPTP